MTVAVQNVVILTKAVDRSIQNFVELAGVARDRRRLEVNKANWGRNGAALHR
jgi:hypothetical protein